MTIEHFKDITNGNLTSFEIAPDEDDLAIYFKRKTGELAIRPIDNKKLANLLNIILNVHSEFATPDLRFDVCIK